MPRMAHMQITGLATTMTIRAAYEEAADILAPVTSKKGVIGFSSPLPSCDASRSSVPQIVRLRCLCAKFWRLGWEARKGLPVSARMARSANPFEPPPPFSSGCGGCSKTAILGGHSWHTLLARSRAPRTLPPSPPCPSKPRTRFDALQEAYHAASCVRCLLVHVENIGKSQRYFTHTELTALHAVVDSEVERRWQIAHAAIHQSASHGHFEVS